MSSRYENGVLVENSEEHIAALAAEAARNAASIAALQENEMREQRNDLLASSDWTQANDSPLTDEAKASWVTYRTALRNLPNHSNWPNLEDSDWPVKPS